MKNRHGIILVSAAALALLSGCASYYDDPYYSSTSYTDGYYPASYTEEYTAPAPDGYREAWLASCTKRYRSFDPISGTYLGYDRQRHYCTL
jgi:hypothetical protein